MRRTSSSWATAVLCLHLCVHYLGLAYARAATPDETFVVAESLTGSVVDSAGKPVSGAKVYLLKSPKPGGYYSLPTNPLSTTSDAEGEFRFEGLEAGNFQLWAESELETSATSKFTGQKIKVDPEASDEASQQTEVLQVQTQPGCGYEILVVDEDRRPVSNASVSFAWTDIRREYLTDDEGKVQIRHLVSNDWYFVVRAKGYGTSFFKTSKQEPGEVLEVPFTLGPGVSWQGRIVDEKGEPVSDVRLTIGSATISMSPSYVKARTDDQGMFSVSGLPTGAQLRFLGIKDGFEMLRDRFAATTEKREWTMTRRPYGGDVKIQVLDEEGVPIAGAVVSNRGSSSSDAREAATNAEGIVLLEDVFRNYAGHQFYVKAKGYVAQRKSVEPGPKGEPSALQFELAKGNTVRGRVLSPEGKPMANIKVYYDRGERGDLLGGRVLTDKDGQFRLEGLGPTAILTIYTPREYAPIDSITIRTDLDEFMELKLVPAGLLKVRAIDGESGEPINAFNVRLGYCEDRQSDDIVPKGINSTLVDQGVNISGSNKVFVHDNEVVGTAFKVTVSAAGFEPTVVARMLTREAEAEPVDVPLVRAKMADYQVVSGRLLDALGKPVVGANVRLLVGRAVPFPQGPGPRNPKPMGGWRYYHWGLLSRDDIEGRDECVQLLKTTSDQDGKFKFEGVRRDMPWIELFYFGEEIYDQRYSNLADYEEEGLSDLELRATRPARLTVTIDLKDRPDVDRISLNAEDYVRGINAIQLPFGSESQQAEAVNLFERLPPGNYTILLQAKPEPLGNGGYSVKTLTSQAIEIKEGEDKEVEL